MEINIEKWNKINNLKDCPVLNKKVVAIHDNKIYIGDFERDSSGYCWRLENEYGIEFVDVFEVDAWLDLCLYGLYKEGKNIDDKEHFSELNRQKENNLNIKILNTLELFKDASYNLLSVWEKDQSNENILNSIAGYPFHKDFFELFNDILNWVTNTKDRLHK